MGAGDEKGRVIEAGRLSREMFEIRILKALSKKSVAIRGLLDRCVMSQDGVGLFLKAVAQFIRVKDGGVFSPSEYPP